VELLQRRGLSRRGAATGVAYVFVLAGLAGIAALFIPTVVHQVNNFADKVPDYIDDLTEGRGRLGFLETKYHIVERVRNAVEGGGVKRILGIGGTAALSVTKSVLTTVAAVVTIAFMTLFMLLEGPKLMDRIYGLLPEHQQPRWRKIGYDIYQTVGGYVSGNLFISLIAGLASGALLFIVGVPFAVALGLLVAILDLIPLAGATIAAILVVLVTLAANNVTDAIIVAVFFIVYQQIENHILQPVVYGRTVKLSPLVVLIAVLIGAEVAGVLGALGAIPVAGAIQVIIVDWQEHRRRRIIEPPGETTL
jgi:predicted PurR-regulated permease PerM